MKISPSLLAADFLHLDKEVEMINESQCDWLHIDVMDGDFVPNISYGFSVVEPLSKVCKKPLDVHYMINHPERYINRTAQLGAMMMNVHYEACSSYCLYVIRDIHAAGMLAGVTINPGTPVSAVEPYLNAGDEQSSVDMVLLMGVDPGFGGQKFSEATYEKVRELRKMIERCGRKVLIEVDGGVNGTNAPLLAEAGADILVSGNYIFKSEDPKKVIAELKAL